MLKASSWNTLYSSNELGWIKSLFEKHNYDETQYFHRMLKMLRERIFNFEFFSTVLSEFAGWNL